MARTLNARQSLFIGEYLVDLNATAAAIRAGYSEDTAYSIGHELLKKGDIKQEIDKRLDRRQKRLGADADYVISSIVEVMEISKDITSDKYNAAAVLRGAELLGKNLKMFTEKLEVETQETRITSINLNI